ncbi:MAG TPA: histidine kinase [Gemmatimonadaceae bacterium]|nr:histidine kinase [Gemmatimonadaceae bacterium]
MPTAVAIALGVYASTPQLAGSGGTSRPLPRIPPPPPDLPALLNRLGVGSVIWYAAAIAFPFLVWGARRLDAERQWRWRTIGMSIVVVAGLIGGSAAVEYLVTYGGAPFRPGAASYLTVALRQDVLPWVAVVGIVAAIELRRRAIRTVVERERLHAQVAEQRLIALTAQLHPHFLFNTLQGISTLMHRDPDAADEMLAKLSDLLRDVLRSRDQLSAPLEDELRHARTYLEIAEMRFAGRLAFDIDVPAELHQVSVPLFILQPLVENALAHGIGGRLRGGRITVTARERRGRLQLEVADDGAGLPAATSPRSGIGLANSHERLLALFGDDQSLVLEPRAAGGMVARIDIPCRPYVARPGRT